MKNTNKGGFFQSLSFFFYLFLFLMIIGESSEQLLGPTLSSEH